MSFHHGSSFGTGCDDGPSAWPSSLSTPETEELFRYGLLVPPGCRLPHDCKVNKYGYPTCWPGAIAEEKRTGGRCNIAGRHAFWDDKEYAAVIGAFRLAESGETPDLTDDRRRLLAQRRRDASGRRAPPPPASAPADPPAPPEAELPPKQVVLREDSDSEDTPGYLVALLASAAAAAAATEAAEQVAAIQAAAAIPAVVPLAVQAPDEDDIDWDRLARESSDDDDVDGGDGPNVIYLVDSDDEE